MSKQYLIVSEQVGNFLENKSYKTPREKVAFMASIYEAERRAEDPLVLSDGDYDIIMRILDGEEFVVDTGKFYINVGAPINREEFLCVVNISRDDEGNRLFDWGLDTLENAYLFSKENFESIVPKAFRGDDFKVLERVAQRRKVEVEDGVSFSLPENNEGVSEPFKTSEEPNSSLGEEVQPSEEEKAESMIEGWLGSH